MFEGLAEAAWGGGGQEAGGALFCQAGVGQSSLYSGLRYGFPTRVESGHRRSSWYGPNTEKRVWKQTSSQKWRKILQMKSGKGRKVPNRNESTAKRSLFH